jgi:hypothetical protein
MPITFTYGPLAQRLRELGYTDTHKTLHGKPVWLFEHNRQQNAMILLPPMPPDQPVDSMHLNGIRSTLHIHGVLREQPERFLFPITSGGEDNGESL